MEYPNGFCRDTHSRKPICGVLAVAFCAGVSFDVAHAACKRAMHELKLGVRFRGGTWLRQLKHALKGFGVRFTEYKPYDNPTIELFAAHRAEPGFTYLLDTPGHFVTLRDGIVADQRHNCHYSVYPRRRKGIKAYLRIDGKGW